MLKRLGVFLGTAALALGVSHPASANHNWENYHWARAQNPFTLTLVDSLEPKWDSYLPLVSSDWGQSNVLDTSIAVGASDLVTRLTCLPASGKVVNCNANYGPNLWLGLATIWLSGDHITQGTVQVNDFYFESLLYDYDYKTERRHVLCQEVGHTIGLGHTSEDGSSQNTCMDYYTNTSNADTKSTTPNQHDYDTLASIYSHLDGGGGGGGCHGKNCPGSASGGNRSVVVGRDGDLWMITYILWVE